MAIASGPARVFYFGVFELDLREGELRKHGLKIKLQELPLRILAMLLERAGELITREELREKLWPADVFVDFDHSLNKAVNKLREALGDTAENPRFVETVPRRGYRFIAPVRVSDDELSADHAASELQVERRRKTDTEATQRAAGGGAAVPSGPPLQGERTGRLILWAAVLAPVFILAIGAAVWFHFSGSSSESSIPPMKTVPLTSFVGRELQPAFSPDSKQVAFVWNGEKSDNFDIYVKLIGEGTPLRLTRDPAEDLSPAWSPDGRYVAFLRQSATGQEIFVVPALGGPERKLGLAGGLSIFGRSLDWSPDGKFLAIVDRSSPRDPFAIFLFTVENGEKRRLTSPPAQSLGDNQPAFSPGGETVAFTRTGSNNVDDIYLAPTAGGEPRRLTFDDRPIGGLAWTPEGREIVFSSNRAGSPSLWRISVSGGKPKLLAVMGLNPGDPSFSRHGHRFAYTQWTVDTNIWRIERPGIKDWPWPEGPPPPGAAKSGGNRRASPPIKLISSTQRDDSPQFSPDGKKIVFASERTGSYEIWVCDRDGLNPIQLTSFGGPLTGTPRWSPDGQHVAFDSRPAGHADIFVVKAEGGPPRRLTTESSEDVVPSWSRDGRWIYFASNRSGDFQVWKAPAGGGHPVQVTKKGGFEAFESPDGKFVYYAQARGAAGIWRVPVEGGEETPIPELRTAGYWRYWAVVDQGIVFVPQEVTPRATIQFFSFATGGVTPVATLEKGPILWTPGLAVSPDGRWLLYAQEDQRDSDITLVENFR